MFGRIVLQRISTEVIVSFTDIIAMNMIFGGEKVQFNSCRRQVHNTCKISSIPHAFKLIQCCCDKTPGKHL